MNGHGLANLKRNQLAPHEVLTKVYEELIGLGTELVDVKREIKGEYLLASWSDPHRTDSCYLKFNGVIATIDDKGTFIFALGETEWSWNHLAGFAQKAIMFGEVKWDEVLRDNQPLPFHKSADPWPAGLPSKEAVAALTDEQVERIVNRSGHTTLDPRQLVIYRRQYIDEVGIRDGYDSNRLEFKDTFIHKTSDSGYDKEVVSYLVAHIHRKLSIE